MGDVLLKEATFVTRRMMTTFCLALSLVTLVSADVRDVRLAVKGAT